MNNKIRNINYSVNLYKIYKNLIYFIVPLLIVQLILHYFKVTNLQDVQLIIIYFALVGLIIFKLLSKVKKFIEHFYEIQLIFLYIIMILELVWYVQEPNERQFVSLILGTVISGIAVIKLKRTVIYYSILILAIVIINIVFKAGSFEFFPYILITTICISFFNLFIEKLTQKITESEETYKKMFYDANDLIFVLEYESLKVVEYNRKAELLIKAEKGDVYEIKNQIFCQLFSNEEDNVKIIESIKIVKEKQNYFFETDSISSRNDYLPKEFSLRVDYFLNQKAIFVTIKVTKDRKDFERKYIQLFEKNLAGVYKTNVEGEIIECNRSFCEILGFDNEFELKTHNIKEFYDSNIKREEYINLLREKRTLSNYITILKDVYGDTKIVNNNAYIIEENDVEYIGGTIVDVTELVETTEALKQNEEKFKLLFEQSSHGIIIVKNELIIDCNRNTTEKFNLSKIEILNKKLDYFSANTESLYNKIAKKDNNFEWKFKNAENVFYAEISVSQININKEKYYQISFIDITDRKIKEEKLIQSEESFKNIVDGSPAAILIFSEENNLLYVNTKGDIFYKEHLNHKSNYLDEIFSKNHYFIIENLINESNSETKSYNEIKFDDKQYSIQVVKVVFNNQKANLFLFGDISLQNQYNLQKLRAEVAEEANEKLILEIKKNEVSQANIRALIEAIPDIIFKVNKEGLILEYEINSQDQLEFFNQFININKLNEYKLFEIFGENKNLENIVEFNLKQVQDTNETFSQQLEVKYKERLVYFELRYAKINDNEILIIIRNKSEEIEYEKKLKETIQEKEVLLKEVHHRVKNNLQIINSILNLQSSYITDSKIIDIINESQNRIRSMSYIHESLYQTKNFSSLNFKGYIENLLTNLVYSYNISESIEIKKEIEEISLILDQAIPCGLILNELLTNALKYAYPNSKKGEIFIHLYQKKNKVYIEIQDFGIGLPKNFNIEEVESLGLSLVHTLVQQIDGEIEIKSDAGTKILIIFEKLQ